MDDTNTHIERISLTSKSAKDQKSPRESYVRLILGYPSRHSENVKDRRMGVVEHLGHSRNRKDLAKAYLG